MSAKKRRFIYFIAASATAIGTLYGACYFSYLIGERVAIQESFACQALHTERELSALENLQKQLTKNAQSNLETGVDVGIFFMTIPANVSVMTEHTRSNVHEVLLKAKKYRKEYPWSGYDKEVNQRIIKALDEVSPHP